MREKPPTDKEISLRAIVVFIGGIIGVLGVTAIVTWGFYVRFRGELQASDPPRAPLEEANEPSIPPQPRLQTSPPRDMAAMRAREDAVLGSYAWVDKDRGIGRIPIDRAIDLAAKGISAPKPPLQDEPERRDGGAP